MGGISINSEGQPTEGFTIENQEKLNKKTSEKNEQDKKDKPTLQKDSSGRVTNASPEDFIKMFSPKKMAKGGKVKSASTRADGCAIRGKTRA
jgi:hypothetical protein